ncbi:MAG: hypothetical protein LBP92_04155 [Deltaproteobacteria bacterium]|jgi:hypothetical protein|nr:hypothetical protein [Deltaproteobacteria bacterium]
MSGSGKNNPNPKATGQETEPFDRQGFLKNLRNEFLNKIGLPENTKPGQVVQILEIKKELELIKARKNN